MGAAAEFEVTCLPHLGDCRAFAISLAGNPHDADDLVQETYLKAQRSFATFQTGTNAKAWLFTILRRIHVDRYRRARLRPAPIADEEIERRAPPVPAGGGDPPGDLPPGAVLRALESVPEPYRLPVRLRDLDGLSYREIGEVLDIPPGTVMSRLHRGREYVRAALVASLKERRDGPR